MVWAFFFISTGQEHCKLYSDQKCAQSVLIEDQQLLFI